MSNHNETTAQGTRPLRRSALSLPKLYAILDAESCTRRALALLDVAARFRDAGVRWLQYRDKSATDEAVLQNAIALRRLFSDDTTLILNDRVHLFAATGFDGVHVGQGDRPVTEVRKVIGPDVILGISTHNPAEFAHADAMPVSYVAVGPVFGTQTKLDAQPVVGLDGVRQARSLTRKPLVAIGGITAANAQSVLDAGAASVAVISALLKPDATKLFGSLLQTNLIDQPSETPPA